MMPLALIEVFSVTEADRTRISETKGGFPGPLRGGEPIRKRGYYRALKRGEAWAIQKKNMQDMLNTISTSLMKEW
jgi:hypothetical protein